MSNELTYDLALPDSIPVRFKFGERFPELALELKADYSIRDAKQLENLSTRWQQYFATPDEQLADSDHAKARLIVDKLVGLAALNYDDERRAIFVSLPEMAQMKIVNIIGRHVGEILGSGEASGSARADADPNAQGLESSLQPLRAPMAEPSALG